MGNRNHNRNHESTTPEPCQGAGSVLGWPKPDPRERAPKPLTRTTPLRVNLTTTKREVGPSDSPKPLRRSSPLRSTGTLVRGKRMKRTNAYMHPEYRAHVRAFRKGSDGTCQLRLACSGGPRQGDPHHRSYLDFEDHRRLLVPFDQLVDTCHRCHVVVEEAKARGLSVEELLEGAL